MDRLEGILQQYWGYDRFRPLQREAMECVVNGQDSVVVLPTGGGKSLCYQVPALYSTNESMTQGDASRRPTPAVSSGVAVIVSPLISLMKDQVDGLRACGVPAACVNSTQSFATRREIAHQIRSGELRLLYVSPERLVTERMIDFLQSVQVSFFAIDEAHCISSWGHDFRPEFRGLSRLREDFPQLAIHAYTATASRQVRHDIAGQLGLRDPQFLVGSFDRPNLTYRVRPREKLLNQILEVVASHPEESGIVYCISRADVERTALALQEKGYRALPYHAGLADEERKRNQEAFIEARADVIVATVAFGMGIDKPNVRYVIHAGMPKSLENYQQESGRAGRDGLPSDCWLFYSSGDYMTWRRMINHEDEAAQRGAMESLRAMSDFCTSVICRHRHLVEYFGQQLDCDSCGACDVCLDELHSVDDPLVLGQKILSCVIRLRQRYGADYTAQVLVGSREHRIVQMRHDQLSTYGLLSEYDRRTVRQWIEQLVAQEFIERVGEYNTLQVTGRGRRVLKGECKPKLLRPTTRSRRSASSRQPSPSETWEGVDRKLFEVLRTVRRDQAERLGVPAYIVFGDASLRDMARRKPQTLESFREVKGVGEKKCRDFANCFLEAIRDHEEEEQKRGARDSARGTGQ